MPVSYTHLDVYKRQPNSSNKCINSRNQKSPYMKKPLLPRLVSLFTAIFLTTFFSFSQVNFNFSVSPGSCRPFTVTFTNTTVGATSYKWYFGDGDSSTQQNPVHIFKHGSRYNVQLMAWNGGSYIGDRWQDVYLPGGPNSIQTDKDLSLIHI